MKIKNISLVLLITLFFTVTANAQYGYGTNYGLDRSIGAQDRYSTPKKKKEYDFVKVSTENMVKELQLDGFQEAIIKTIFEDYKNAVTNISEEDIPSQAKYEKMQIQIDKLDAKILDLLTKEQKVKFAAFKEKTSKKKKVKKGEAEEKENEAEEK